MRRDSHMMTINCIVSGIRNVKECTYVRIWMVFLMGAQYRTSALVISMLASAQY